jgi:hypothetical protein
VIEEFNLALDAVTRPWQVVDYSGVAQTLSSILQQSKIGIFSGLQRGVRHPFQGAIWAASATCWLAAEQQRLKYPLPTVIFGAHSTT